MSEANKPREFIVLIARDEDGLYVASVPELRGCHTQARSLDELTERIKEAILLCLETSGEDMTEPALEFIGLQKITV